MASRTNLARVGAAVLGVSAALMVGALPANAGTSGSAPNAAAAATVTAKVVSSGDQRGSSLTMGIAQAEGGGTVHTDAVLMDLALSDGSSVPSYCIDLTTELQTSLTMTEQSWDKFQSRQGSTFHQNNKYINWILQNSFPSVSDTQALAKSASITDTLSKQDAITGTQAAIWHYSDGATLEAKSVDADADALYTYLTGSANVGIDESVLSVSPNSAITATAGKLAGPFTVTTNLTDVKIDTKGLPEGVKLTDANGNAITSVSNGSKIYLDDASGTAAATGAVKLTGNAPAGRIFEADKPSQQLIAAGSTTVTAALGANWTAATTTTTPSTAPTTPAKAVATGPTGPGNGGGLAYTGVSATGPIVLGILLVAGGGLLLLVQRRLKRA